jgi:hypothetical protein
MEIQFPETLINRKQFFFGHDKIASENWISTSMPDGNILSTHPDLECTQVTKNGFQVTLLGYLLDPNRVQDGNEQILTRLCETANTIPQLIDLTDPLSGRWILFIYHLEEAVVMNDPAGLRAVFYYLDSVGKVWLASQPGLLAQKFGLQVSPEAAEFITSPRYLQRKERWFTGDSSLFAKVQHLLPNHLFDLKSKTVRRFWPTQPLQRISLEQGVEQVASILKNSVLSAHHRGPLAMSMSSGVDSRMIFSACKDLSPEIYFFSMMYRSHTEESDDIRVPRAIAKQLNLTHHVLDSRGEMGEKFKPIYSQQVTGIDYDWGAIVEQRNEFVPRNSLVLKGSISEIVRCRYFATGAYPYRVTLPRMVNLMNVGYTSLVYDTLQGWMREAIGCETLNYRLLDLLSWECEVGNYISLGQMLYDLAQEDFCPLNNRQLLRLMLGVDEKYRSYPLHIMERKVIGYLWPELLEFPFTPSRKLPQKSLRDNQFLQWLKYFLLENKKNRLEK